MGDLPRIVALTRADAADLLDIDQWAFAFDDEDVDAGPTLDALEWDRMYGARLADPDGDQLAGIHGVRSCALPVPGGGIPAAALTWVGVHPQFRRRGVLRTMIGFHLGDARERGEPVSILNASEAGIYGRFGYGLAGRHLFLTPSRGAELRDVPGADDVRVRFERVDVTRHADLVGDCYEAARRDRPGMLSRNTPALRREALHDPPRFRRGKESLRIAVAEGDPGGPARGYALFRRSSIWSGPVADGTVEIREFVARDPAAACALWRRLLDLDLMTTVQTDPRPVDDVLLHLLVDPRAARPMLVDGVWVRIVDVPAALSARRYSAPVDVVLEVTDALLPENAGHWRLVAGPDGARCERSGDAADLGLDVRELGAAYLGSESLAAMAAAGLVTGDEGAVARASAAFAWPVAAYCGWEF